MGIKQQHQGVMCPECGEEGLLFARSVDYDVYLCSECDHAWVNDGIPFNWNGYREEIMRMRDGVTRVYTAASDPDTGEIYIYEDDYENKN